MTSKPDDEEVNVSSNSGEDDGWLSGLGGSLEKQKEKRQKELEEWQTQMGKPLSEIKDEETGETVGFWESNDGGLVAYRKMKCGYHHDYLFGYYSPEVIEVIFSLKKPGG